MPRNDPTLSEPRALDAVMLITVYNPSHFDRVNELWKRVLPDDPPHNHAERSIPAKVAHQPELFFVALADSHVVGTTMAGYDGHRGWLYSVAVDPDRRRRGIATAMVRHVEETLAAMGCVKINLQIRAGNEAVAAFYQRLGYEAEPRASMGKLIEHPRTGRAKPSVNA